MHNVNPAICAPESSLRLAFSMYPWWVGRMGLTNQTLLGAIRTDRMTVQSSSQELGRWMDLFPVAISCSSENSIINLATD